MGCSKSKEMKVATYVLQAETKNLFDVVDSDGDGHLTLNEVMTLLEQANIVASKQDVADFINVNDKDGDGKIDFYEFRLVLREQIKARASNLVALFTTYDSDHDKRIDYYEFKRLLHSIGSRANNEHLIEIAAKHFPQVDSTIGLKEFCEIFSEFV